MNRDVLVRTKRSGGTLAYEDLIRYASDRDVQCVVVDYECISNNYDSNKVIGAEFFSNLNINFVVYTRDNKLDNIIKFIDAYNHKMNKQLKENIAFVKMQNPNNQIGDVNEMKTIGDLLKAMIKCGIVVDINQGLDYLKNYGMDISELMDIIQLFD